MESTTDTTPENQNPITINQTKLDAYKEKLKLEQNLIMAIAGGTAAALVGAVLWAVITVATKYQIGYMAIGVGLLVGFTVRYLGKGIDMPFGIIGALFALLGCLLGNYFSVIGFTAAEMEMNYWDVLAMIPMESIPEIMMDTFQPMDILFYGFAIYEGYKFSFRVLSDQEILDNAGERKVGS